MNTVLGESTITLEINKSTFISNIISVDTVEAAKAYFTKIRSKYPDASHHVTVYIIGKGGEYGHYSDDGEPSGTAGLPVFDVFRKNQITNIACVITRYFGGIKLGAGGLVRAYSRSASENLHQMVFVKIIEYTKIELSFAYQYLREIDLALKDYEVILRQFTSNVTLIVKLPKDDLVALTKKLISVTSSLIHIRIIE